MNIKFKAIDIENFRSITKAHINLDSQGTVVVKGINEYEDNASSNGSGKSSIFEAIVFTIFDETSTGDKNVENRIIGNGYNLKLVFDIDDVEYCIIRKYIKKKTTVELYKNNIDISARNKTDTNKLILGILNINKNIFLDSIFLSQSVSTNLTSLQPTARKERLEILTNTDATINNFKEKLKNTQYTYESKLIDVDKEINYNTGSKSTLETQIQEIDIKISNINAEIQRKNSLGNIDDIEKQINEKTTKITDILKSIEDIDNNLRLNDIELNKYNENIKEIENEIQPYEEKLQEKRDYYTKCDNDIKMLQNNINQANKNINRINNEIEQIKNSDTCPTCGRKYENVDSEHIKQVIESKQTNIENEQNLIDTCNKNIDEITQYINNTIKEADEINKDKQILLNKKLDIEFNITNITQKTKELSIQKDKMYNNIQLLQNERTQLDNLKIEIFKINTDGLEELQNEKQQKLEQLNNINDDIQNLQNKSRDLINQIDTVKHILQLITKEFRTYLLQSSVNYLNELLNKYSKELFSNSGDIIKINSEDTKLDIYLGNSSYESLSGGEKTRVDIALLLAQKSLASVIGNINYNIIILDEILGYCDSEAELNILNLVMSELNTLESIYMISHKELPVPYDIQLIVTKNKQGLSTVKEF